MVAQSNGANASHQGEAALSLARGCYVQAQTEVRKDLAGLDRVLVVRS